ncbi:hypothetical protein OPQ81_011460 [Rhizoctonia solani]|nr:hypothetical protein OPQ81_011460 [Rhizoctonia solani]
MQALGVSPALNPTCVVGKGATESVGVKRERERELKTAEHLLDNNLISPGVRDDRLTAEVIYAHTAVVTRDNGFPPRVKRKVVRSAVGLVSAPDPSLGGVSSALDVSPGSVRRRVSGPHSIPSPPAHSNPTGEAPANLFEDCVQDNPFSDASQHNPFDGVVQQETLTALGRELEDRPLPPLPTHQPTTESSSPKFENRYQGVHSNGILSKLEHKLRVLKNQPGPNEINNSQLGNDQVLGCDELLRHHSKGTQSSTAFSGISSLNIVRLVPQQGAPFLSVTIQDHAPTQPGSPALLAATHAATDRFTRRFPISVSHRKANATTSEEDQLLPLLGYGETGAVVEWPNAWTPEKWSLLLSVCSVFVYGLTVLVLALMTWFGIWPKSIIMRIVDYDILVTITSASLIVFGTSLFGICGTLLNSRPLLAIYCVLLWPSFAAMLVVGYTSYRRSAFALPSKMDQAWSQKFGEEDRLILQYLLKCCGYWSPEHSAASSPLCFPRSPLPGCKARIIRFERTSLGRYYTWTFSLVPLHILNIITALLCSNHVNRLFGKGLTPWKYRLRIEDVRANALRVLETYRDTLVPREPGRVYALKSKKLGNGASRSPRIPQQGEQEQGGYGLPFTQSQGSLFGFRKRTVGGV